MLTLKHIMLNLSTLITLMISELKDNNNNNFGVFAQEIPKTAHASGTDATLTFEEFTNAFTDCYPNPPPAPSTNQTLKAIQTASIKCIGIGQTEDCLQKSRIEIVATFSPFLMMGPISNYVLGGIQKFLKRLSPIVFGGMKCLKTRCFSKGNRMLPTPSPNANTIEDIGYLIWFDQRCQSKSGDGGGGKLISLDINRYEIKEGCELGLPKVHLPNGDHVSIDKTFLFGSGCINYQTSFVFEPKKIEMMKQMEFGLWTNLQSPKAPICSGSVEEADAESGGGIKSQENSQLSNHPISSGLLIIINTFNLYYLLLMNNVLPIYFV